ncbi:MAG: 3-isopropylmalate dehydratase small subunit [Longimicrobiales bacterium]
MEPFIRHTGVVAPLDRADVDTDQIVPKQFLKRVERAGFGRHLFHDWRFDDAGAPLPGFVLNRPEHLGASILVARRNFGCGSSREHAAWALQDFGFRAIIAPSFADIFRENADQNGIVTVELDDEVVGMLLARAGSLAPYTLTVDLAAGRVADRDGALAGFAMDPFRRTCLMEGLDRIGLTLRHEPEIAAFEATRA